VLSLRIIAVAIAALCSVASARAARSVRFDELAAHPARYHRDTVLVAAWLQVDTAHKIASLRPKPHADMSDLPEILLDCPRWLPDSQIYAAANHRVHVCGRFQYHNTHGATRPGVGWGGIFDKQITQITEFKVLK
jgi:hypothetical protein